MGRVKGGGGRVSGRAVGEGKGSAGVTDGRLGRRGVRSTVRRRRAGVIVVVAGERSSCFHAQFHAAWP